MEVDHELVSVDEFDALNITLSSDVAQEKPVKYPAKLHARQVLSNIDVSDGLIYLVGEPSRLYEDSDMAPPFRQRRYFYYVSGADFPDCVLTIEIASRRLILWIPYVEPRQVLWHGFTPGIAECLSRFDVDDVRYICQLPQFLGRVLTPATNLFVLHPDQIPALDTATLSRSMSLSVSSMNACPITRSRIRGPIVDTERLRVAMDAARVIKSDYEICMIRKANAVSSAAHIDVARRLWGMKNECEIEAMFVASCTANGARTQAYPVIAAAGTNASTLHYERNNAPLAGSLLVVLDAGCEWNCYASDITRTLPLRRDGVFCDEAAQIYDLVNRMQSACIRGLRPGADFRSLYLRACRLALLGLQDLGVLRGPFEQIWAAGTVSAFFPHGLGHHVGLEVHDVSGPDGLLPSDSMRLDVGKREIISPLMLAGMVADQAVGNSHYSQLRTNMVVTVEPGIYFCREYIEGYFLRNPDHSTFINCDRLEDFYPVGGVRIEDDFLITEDGYEDLTTVPKEQLRLQRHRSEPVNLAVMAESQPSLTQCAWFAAAFKILLFPAYKSTDFEVHRNWLAVTSSLPLKNWYVEHTSQWTLDYPPLFAYFECALAQIGRLVDPAMLRVYNLEYDSWQTIYFQRCSVIATELLLVHALQMFVNSSATAVARRAAQVAALSILLSPGLLIIDHIHFQYNGFLYGMLVLSLVMARSRPTLLWSGLTFTALLCLKHIYLYLAPAYFVFLLRSYCLSSRSVFRVQFLNCVELGGGILAIAAVAFGPFAVLGQIPQLLGRLFPFSRGLCHAYWAPNFWALYSFADRIMIPVASRLRLPFNPDAVNSVTRGLVGNTNFAFLPEISPRTCFLLTLVFQAVPLFKLFRRPTWDNLVGGVTACGYASFLFGWHVHEKAILLVIIPFSLIALKDRRLFSAFRPLAVAGHVSLFPLLFRPAEFPIKTAYTVLWLLIFLTAFDRLAPPSSPTRLLSLDRISTAYITGYIPLIVYCSLIHRAVLGNDLEFLPLMLLSVYSAAGIVGSWIGFTIVQMMA